MTLLVGNLDCEVDFAARTAGRGRRSLRRSALRMISGAATLMRVFAKPGDRLWTSLPVDPDRLPPVPASTAPELISGPLRPAAGEAVLAWGGSPSLSGRSPRSAAESLDPSLGGRLRSIGPPPLGTAAEVNHRGLALRLARDLGCALPGARLIESIGELRRHLVAGGAEAGEGGSWVVKAPHSAAGRLRFIAPSSLEPASILEDRRVEARIVHLLRMQGVVLFEPWMSRVDDWGCSVWVGEDACEEIGLHSLIVARDGRFEGVASVPSERDSDDEFRTGLTARDRETLRSVAGQVARALQGRGYRGPVTVDSWRYRSARAVHLHPLGEINARLTFGWVWRGWRERLIEIGWIAADQRLELRLGRRLPRESPRVLPLLTPSADDRGVAWLVRGPTA